VLLMIILELSAGQGPAECCVAVALALKRLLSEAGANGVAVQVVEKMPGPVSGSLQSVSMTLEGAHAAVLAKAWEGGLQWVCPSRLRPNHGRKNWFFAGAIYELPAAISADGIRIETMRAMPFQRTPAGGMLNSTELKEILATIKAVVIDESFEEFQLEAEQVRAVAVRPQERGERRLGGGGA